MSVDRTVLGDLRAGSSPASSAAGAQTTRMGMIFEPVRLDYSTSFGQNSVMVFLFRFLLKASTNNEHVLNYVVNQKV